MINFTQYFKDKENETEDYIRAHADSYIENLNRWEIIELIDFYVSNKLKKW